MGSGDSSMSAEEECKLEDDTDELVAPSRLQ